MMRLSASLLRTLTSGTVLAASLLITGAKQYQIGSRGFGAAAVAGCTAPTAYETAEWPMFGSVTCTSGCTTGNKITAVPEVIGANNLSSANNTSSPTYLPAAFGSLADANFDANQSQFFTMGTGFTPSGPISVWVTFIANTASGGGFIGGATNGAFYYRLSASHHQDLLVGGISDLGTGTAVFTAGTKYTIGVSFTPNTGVYNFYTFSGGSYASDGSGTAAATTFTQATQFIGEGSNEFLPGQILDIGYFNGTWDATALNAIATYSQCKAGV